MNHLHEKWFTGALSAVVLLSAISAAHAGYLSDIGGHWAQSKIQVLNNQNIIGGYPDGSFRPEGTITRAELAAVLVKAFNLPTMPVQYTTFKDVPATFWGASVIEAVKTAGLVNGYPGDLFKPFQPVTRLEAMAILANANPANFPDATATESILNRFGDSTAVPMWGRNAVSEVVNTGIFENRPGYTNLLEPSRNVTRGELAAMVNNLLTAKLSTQNNGQMAMTNPMNTPMNSGSMSSSSNSTMTSSGQLEPLKGHVAMIPALTEFSGSVKTPVSSEIVNVGDQIRLTIDNPLVSPNNIVVVPYGSEIIGSFTEVNSAKRLGKNATMAIRFKEIITPNGERIPIQGSVATQNGLLEAGNTKGRILSAAGKTALGAGIGAALGTAMGPLSGGKVGKGAIYGTAVGAGVGALAAAGSKGQELELLNGEKIQIRLDTPIQFSTNQ